jgi:hypothetical protein
MFLVNRRATVQLADRCGPRTRRGSAAQNCATSGHAARPPRLAVWAAVIGAAAAPRSSYRQKGGLQSGLRALAFATSRGLAAGLVMVRLVRLARRDATGSPLDHHALSRETGTGAPYAGMGTGAGGAGSSAGPRSGQRLSELGRQHTSRRDGGHAR